MSDTTPAEKSQDIINSERHAMDMKSMRQQLKERKMEQARRNAEMLSKYVIITASKSKDSFSVDIKNQRKGLENSEYSIVNKIINDRKSEKLKVVPKVLFAGVKCTF